MNWIKTVHYKLVSDGDTVKVCWANVTVALICQWREKTELATVSVTVAMASITLATGSTTLVSVTFL